MLGRELVRFEAVLARCFCHIVAGKGFQHHLELKRRCMGFQFLGHEIYLRLAVQYISHLPRFPLRGQAPLWFTWHHRGKAEAG